jgi:hypothetical protein
MKKSFKLSETLAIKLGELTELRNSRLPSFALPVTIYSFDELISIKNKLYQALRSEIYKNIKYPVTNLGFGREDWFGTKIQYHYTRQGLQPLSPLVSLYGLSEKFNELGTGFFTTTCQSANYSVLFSLLTGYDVGAFSKTNRMFFETQDILRYIKSKPLDDGPVKVKYLDSSAESVQFPESVENEEIIIVDTTCFFKGDQTLTSFIKKSLLNKWKVILTRSHLKLDGNGAEYGLLGSIVLLSEFEFPVTKPSISFCKTEISFPLLLQKVISSHSYFSTLESIYPFFELVTFNKQINDRAKRSAINYGLLRSSLLNLGLRFYDHNLFITFETNCSSAEISDYQIKSNQYLCSIRNKIGFPIYYVDSFGFDFFSVTAFPDYESQNDLLTCRISIGDLSLGDMEGALKVLPTIISNLK